MDDVFLIEQSQTLDYRVAKPSDEAEAESLVVVLFYQFIQVQAHQLEADA